MLGMGFTFDDTDTKGVATPLAEMHRLIEKDPGNGDAIFPYIGGEEVNDSPTHAHHRYVINFGEQSEEECRARWPELMAIVEEKVKPERMQLQDNPDGRRRKATGGSLVDIRQHYLRLIADLDRVLVTCRHQPQWATHLPAGFGSLLALARRLSLRYPRRILCASVPPTRSMGTILRLVDEGRPSLHAIRLLRDLPISCGLDIRTRP